MVYSHSPTKTHVSLCLAATGCLDPQRRDTFQQLKQLANFGTGDSLETRMVLLMFNQRTVGHYTTFV